MNKNPDYEVLLRAREDIGLSRNGTEYVLRIGNAPYSISFLIPKDSVNKMIENYNRSHHKHIRGEAYGE